MGTTKLGAVEARFADMIWQSAPVSAAELARMAGTELGWKRTTAYTVLRRLCERGLFRCEDGTVTALMSREEYYARQSEQFVEDAFGGSLPAFLAAFGSRKKLSEAEIDQLQCLIDGMREGRP